MFENEMMQLKDGRWVSTTYVKYPPTLRERIKHWFGFCSFCFICRDARHVARNKERLNREKE